MEAESRTGQEIWRPGSALQQWRSCRLSGSGCILKLEPKDLLRNGLCGVREGAESRLALEPESLEGWNSNNPGRRRGKGRFAGGGGEDTRAWV